MGDFGRIKPIYGKWHWPFREMQEGDEFQVSFEDRAPEDVRQMATVRAAQLGIRLSTRKDEEAGVLRVKRIAFDVDNLPALPKAMDFEQVRVMFRNLYEVDADSFPWWRAIEPGQQVKARDDGRGNSIKRNGDDPRRLIETKVSDYRYVVEMLDDKIIATCLAQGETLESWKSAKLAAMME